MGYYEDGEPTYLASVDAMIQEPFKQSCWYLYDLSVIMTPLQHSLIINWQNWKRK